ncbi:MAG: hypothetical protein OXU68_01990, partial [Bacteroidota bacterium]|nr:hypothetical protein [Bacteroidota bacterium]
ATYGPYECPHGPLTAEVRSRTAAVVARLHVFLLTQADRLVEHYGKGSKSLHGHYVKLGSNMTLRGVCSAGLDLTERPQHV